MICGMLGHGDAFVTRDPHGIRPAFYYHNDEIVVVTSERPVIQTALNVRYTEVSELKPGHALIVKKDGSISEEMVAVPQNAALVRSKESISHVAATGLSISKRKELGRLLAPKVLEEIDHNLKDTVFSYIPNTAETAFYGMLEGIKRLPGQVENGESAGVVCQPRSAKSSRRCLVLSQG